MPYDRPNERAALDRPALDPWGMPPTSNSRRDTEDMLSRVSRTEAESSEAYRRIEDHLRTVARRLDSAERSQSENNRAMNKTATDINIATREQAQAFDQLGGHVMSIGDRLDRLEHNAAQDDLKDAVKALQQGLSRLADQITQTANQSAQQVSAISGNLEQMAGQLGQVRGESEASMRHLEARVAAAEEKTRAHFAAVEEKTRGRFTAAQEETRTRVAVAEEEVRNRVAATEDETRTRIATVEEETRARFAAVEEESRNRFTAFETETARVLDRRLAAVEKAAHFNTNALDHALERLEAQAAIRAGDQVELQKRHAETDGAISRLAESVERLESKSADTTLDRRLDGIERSLGNLVSRLESYDPAAALEDTMRAFVHRIETIERSQKDFQGELRANIETVERSHEELQGELRANIETVERSQEELQGKLRANIETIERSQEELQGELRANIETVERSHEELQGELRANLAGGSEPVLPPPEPTYDPAIFDQKGFTSTESDFEAPPFAESASATEHESPPLREQHPFAADAFTTDAAFTPLSEEAADAAFVPLSEETSAEGENFLAAARRSARAAAEAESSRVNKLSFAWNAASTKSEASERPRYLVPAILGFILVLAVAGGLVLNQRARPANPAGIASAPGPRAVPKNAPITAVPKTLPSSGTDTNLPPAQQGAASPAPLAPSANPAPATVNPPIGLPGKPQAQTPTQGAKNPVPTLDRVTQLANGGNAIAQTIIGLKELDADGVPANPADAAKWLERAAGQGQAVAQYRLGAVYERGLGVTANPAMATHWYQLAANQGNRKAMHNLAVSYASGTAGKKDMAEAARWFVKAASLGLADSQFNLAVLYERGDGVPQSLLDAYKWYAIAAGQGDTESRSRLGVLSTQLSADDRNAAQKSATGFRPAPLNRAANIPPEMADLSGN